MLVSGSLYVAGAARAVLHEVIDLAASGNGDDSDPRLTTSATGDRDACIEGLGANAGWWGSGVNA